MVRLLVDISSHGLGHLAQAAPVVNALHAARPELDICIRSALPAERLARRIGVPFRHRHGASDFGYVMRSAIDLDLPATAQRYREAHADWPAAVAAEADWLTAEGFDAVLANAAYLPLAGAARAGIPAAGFSSLNWADLFRHNFGGEAWATPILAQMLEAYNAASHFLRVSPGMPMDGFRNRRIVGPICALGRADRAGIARHLGIDADERWLLVAMGGIDFPIDLAAWPRRPGTRYLVPPALAIPRGDVTAFDDARVDFADLLASADVTLTKPGYGTFVEAACQGRPLLYVPRGDSWAEEICLTDWLRDHARALPVARGKIACGDLDAALAELAALPDRPLPVPSGIGEAVELLSALLKG